MREPALTPLCFCRLATLSKHGNANSTQEQIITMWRENLQGGARRMFDILVSVYPASKTKQDLGLEAGMSPTSGSFGTYLSMLKSNRLIEVIGAAVKASDNLFIEAHK